MFYYYPAGMVYLLIPSHVIPSHVTSVLTLIDRQCMVNIARKSTYFASLLRL